MKKQLTIMATILLSIFLAFGAVFAGEQNNQIEPVEPEVPYETVDFVESELDITSSGLASMFFSLRPSQSGDSSYTVKVSAKLKKGASTVLDTTYTLSWNNFSRTYTANKTRQLSSSGSYTLQTSYKVYSGSTLLETIPCNPAYASY